MITKDMSVLEAVTVVNNYVEKAEEFYLTYHEAVRTLRKAAVFVRNGDTKQLVLKEIKAYENDNQEFVRRYQPLVFSFIYYIFNHPDKASLFVSEIVPKSDDDFYNYKFSGHLGGPLARLLELEKEEIEFNLGGFYEDMPTENLINGNMTPSEFIKAIRKYVEDEQTFNFDTIAKNHKDVVDSYENK
jgi:hypothetical protein